MSDLSSSPTAVPAPGAVQPSSHPEALPNLIECENLVKIYRLQTTPEHVRDSRAGSVMEVQALQGLDLSVHRGEMIGVVGASGSGKSTLLNILGGLDRPTAGRAVVAGFDLGRISARDLDRYRRQMIGFVWQHGARNLIPYLSAIDNVGTPLALNGQGGKAARRRAQELLETVGLAERMQHRLEDLSGGEQQRVAIAIALANRPLLLLADEPTGELDSATAQSIYDLFRRLNRENGLTILIVSHDPRIAHQVDRVVAVRDGKLAGEIRRVQAQDSSTAAQPVHHLEEHVVLDGAGRLQIPRAYLEQFKISRRALLELTDEGILIRPPESIKPDEKKGAAK